MLWQLMRSQQYFDADDGGGEGGGDKGGSQDKNANPGGNEGDKGDAGKGGETKDFKAITSQEDLDAVLKARLDRHEKSISKKLADDIRKQLKDEADAEEATKQGDYKKLFEAEKLKAETTAKELETTKLAAMKTRIAAEHRLRPWAIKRLQGESEEALQADAKELAKDVGARNAPDTEAGEGSKSTETQQKTKTKPDGPGYTFDGKQKVAWPDRV